MVARRPTRGTREDLGRDQSAVPGPPRWRRGEAHAAGAEPGIRECAKVSECCMAAVQTRGWAVGATLCVVTQQRTGASSTVINSAALLFVPYEGLQAEGYGACRILRNQAATSE